ncbi:putative DNA binding domain-containing protein [Fulvivirgaceae bacterium PWU5]|uniref:DNA binding domain-containing protein n=1 Tax=Dawidia cretensis TaxID=2782350 RepID=A0AAP2E3K1_9BACT|nr:ATP-binding protein [Dawidia cretensis]MBT1712433.1 putative DNA binding domain-containing protein [Dawidia cretensis]
MLFDIDQDIVEADIHKLVNERFEEGLTLEFKASGALSNSGDNKKELVKDVSAMANSAGGVVIYGILEKEHAAYALSPIDGNQFNKEWLENVIYSRIRRKIENIRIVPIRIGGKIEQTVYVIIVPESINAPHMADGKYYRRHNFQVLEMDEYEVRGAYSKQIRTTLAIEDIDVMKGDFHEVRLPGEVVKYSVVDLNYYLRVGIRNIGNSIENHFKIYASVPTSLIRDHSTVRDLKGKIDRHEGSNTILVAASNSPLFQNELATVLGFGIQITGKNKDDAINEVIKIKLYYSGGTDEMAISVSELITHRELSLGELIYHKKLEL